jgi:ATP-binding cassette subfamily G (WHITE) protein 2 (PDR)
MQSFFIGFSFYESSHSLQKLTGQIFSIFLTLTVYSNLQQLLIPKFMERRDMYAAVERRSKTYNWKVLISANMLANMPWQFLLSIAIFLVWYYPVGLFNQGDSDSAGEHERGALMFLCVFAFMMFSNLFSALVVMAFGDAQTVVEITHLLYYLILIFYGYVDSVVLNP